MLKLIILLSLGTLTLLAEPDSLGACKSENKFLREVSDKFFDLWWDDQVRVCKHLSWPYLPNLTHVHLHAFRGATF